MLIYLYNRQRGLSPPFQQGGSGEALHQVGGTGNYESAAAESMGATTRGGDAEGARASSLQGVADVRGIPNEVGQTNSRSQGMMPLDPTLLQLLSVSANLTLKEEEENLGKVSGSNILILTQFFYKVCCSLFGSLVMTTLQSCGILQLTGKCPNVHYVVDIQLHNNVVYLCFIY